MTPNFQRSTRSPQSQSTSYCLYLHVGSFFRIPIYLLICWSSPSSLPGNSLVFFYFLTVDFIIQEQPSQPHWFILYVASAIEINGHCTHHEPNHSDAFERRSSCERPGMDQASGRRPTICQSIFKEPSRHVCQTLYPSRPKLLSYQFPGAGSR